MKINNFFGRTAAFFAAVSLFSLTLSGCSLLRPDNGVGRSEITESDTTERVITDSDSETVPPDTTTAAPDTTETEPLPAEKRVSILAVGDNIIHEAVYVDAQNRAADGEKYDFLPMYSGVADKIAAADISFINHETPLAGEEYGISGYPAFNAPREAAEALVELGFDVINLANNHMFDKRASGARATAEYVQSLPVTEIGLYLDQSDRDNIRVTEVNGVRIAWLAFTGESNNPYNPATAGVIMPMLDDDSDITAQIQAAREIADFVIVSAHWGKDGRAQITSEQRRIAQVMADAGADVIVGHHPHIMQSIEWINTESGGKTLVAYSLGNFLSAQLDAENMIGGMLTFDVVMDESGSCSIENPVMNITVNHYNGDWDTTQDYNVHRYGMQMYMLEDYSDALAAKHGCRFFSAEFSMEWIEKFVRSVIDGEFLPACLDS